MEVWIANVVGKMHVNKISNIELAKKLNVTPQYISELLNGKKSPKGAEERITAAVEEIIAEKDHCKLILTTMVSPNTDRKEG